MNGNRNYRALKRGFAREVELKIRNKYDPEAAADILKWISSVTGESFNTSGDMDNFHKVLGDGVLLGKVANALKPNSVPAKNLKPSTLPFKQMEVVNQAVDAFKCLGLKDPEVFQTVDLTECCNLHQVVVCLQAVARKTGHGPKEAQENKREFSEEQLKAGQNVIGLQMGTNKGASQAGMNIGKMRMITDDEKH